MTTAANFQPELTTICPVGDEVPGVADVDITTNPYPTSGAQVLTVTITTDNDDTGVLYLQISGDGTTWKSKSIPSAAVSSISGATLSSGALSVTAASSVVLTFSGLPTLIRFFWDADGGGSAGTLTIKVS